FVPRHMTRKTLVFTAKGPGSNPSRRLSTGSLLRRKPLVKLFHCANRLVPTKLFGGDPAPRRQRFTQPHVAQYLLDGLRQGFGFMPYDDRRRSSEQGRYAAAVGNHRWRATS